MGSVHVHWSLQRPTQGGGRLLSPRETKPFSERVSALAFCFAGVISFLLLNIMAMWPEKKMSGHILIHEQRESAEKFQ